MTEPSTVTTNGSNGTTHPIAPSSASDAGETVDLQALAQFTKHLDSKITEATKSIGKLKDLVPGARPKAEGEDQPAGTTAAPNNYADAIRLGRVMATLPVEAQAHLEAAQAGGQSLTEILRMADAMSIMQKAPPSSGASAMDDAGTGRNAQGAVNRAPPGVAATAASRSAVAHPRTQREFIAICRTDQVRAKQLKDDPSFVLSELPTG